MRVLIAGGHGKIALLLSRILVDSGHTVTGVIRNPDHAADLEAAGARPLALDLEATDTATLAAHLDGVDAVVFAAGAGPGSGPDRKLTVDRDGAVLLRDAAIAAGVSRYVMISAIGADGFDADSDDVFQIYLRAKSEADAAIASSTLQWTIVRPGALTDEPGTGRVLVGDAVPRGPIPRADVAAVIAHVLAEGAATRRTFELVTGNDAITAALA